MRANSRLDVISRCWIRCVERGGGGTRRALRGRVPPIWFCERPNSPRSLAGTTAILRRIFSIHRGSGNPLGMQGACPLHQHSLSFHHVVDLEQATNRFETVRYQSLYHRHHNPQTLGVTPRTVAFLHLPCSRAGHCQEESSARKVLQDRRRNSLRMRRVSCCRRPMRVRGHKNIKAYRPRATPKSKALQVKG
jgi:hypothetical protein